MKPRNVKELLLELVNEEKIIQKFKEEYFSDANEVLISIDNVSYTAKRDSKFSIYSISIVYQPCYDYEETLIAIAMGDIIMSHMGIIESNNIIFRLDLSKDLEINSIEVDSVISSRFR